MCEELDSTIGATHCLAGVRSSLMSIAISAEVTFASVVKKLRST
jgi:hypothetical protein